MRRMAQQVFATYEKEAESKRLVEMIDADIGKREVDMCKGMESEAGPPIGS